MTTKATTTGKPPTLTSLLLLTLCALLIGNNSTAFQLQQQPSHPAPILSIQSPSETTTAVADKTNSIPGTTTNNNSSDSLPTTASESSKLPNQTESSPNTDLSTWTSDDDSLEPTRPLNSNLTNRDLNNPNEQSISSASSIHPLLIYSTRYEIRSLDLYSDSSTRFSSSAAIGTGSAQSLFYDQHHGSKHSKALIGGLKNTIGLDFYCSEDENYIFWTDVIEERIYKGTIINNSITNVEMVVQTGLATAEGLAIDWVGLNIYWVESTLDHIEVANINGSSRRTLLAGDMENPRAIAVDPRYGLLFWTDWDKKSPRIERATMSGDERQTLVQIKELGGSWPNGLTLDYQLLKIYWIDANSDSIHVVNYDGKDHQPLLKNIKSLGHPFSITLFENYLYWTDWKTNSVSMANKHNGSDARELQRLTSRLFDIKVFHPSRQPKVDNHLNPCFTHNGNCSHLCLLSLNNTRKCECPHLMKLAQNNMTCETDERFLLIGRTNEIRAVDINEPLYYVMAPISVPKVFNPRQFEYDSKSRTIFWADSQTNEVKRTQLDVNNIDTIIDVIIESPSGLALDWISENIYVTSISQQKSHSKIFISNLNGEYISILMDGSNGIISPKSLAVHPILGLLFCVDENDKFEPIIFVASMDGENRRIIASKLNDPRLENPSNLAIDYELNRVYWINQASSSFDNASIQYYDIVEDRIVTILDEGDILPQERINPSVLCVDGDYLIVSGRIPTEAIIRLSKHNLTDKTVFKTQHLDQLSALRVYNASSQRGTNACSQNNGGCSQLCVPTSSKLRTCKCTMGYSINPLNETECMGKDLFLIFSYNSGMMGISLNPNSSPDDYYLPPIHKAFRASSIDFVHRDNLIYWVDNEEGSITRINRDTTNYQAIVQGLASEESIGIDWVAGNIYWLDPYYDIIEVARLNGSNRYVIVSGDMDKANGIVVNPIKGYIVWSDIGSSPKIETALLDGSNRRIVVDSNLSHVDDLAIDYVEDYIYWVDSASSLIERVKEDGTGRQVVFSSNSNQGSHNHLVSIAIYGDYLFIADSVQHQGSIIRCDKNNASNRRIIQQHLGDGLRDIAIFAEQPLPNPEDNPCVKNNGGCQDLCLFMGKKGKKRCICSHGKLRHDGLTCRPHDTFVLFSKLSQIDSLHIKDDESFNNSPYPPIAIENRSSIISLTVDYTAQRVIYSDITRDQICSVLFNGTDRKVLVKKQSLVEGIAFANNELYWTSIHDNSISKFSITSKGEPKRTCDGFSCKTATVEKIIKLGSDDKPRGIALDKCTSYVYWTNWNSPNASIQRAGAHNGYKIESIIKTNIKVPNGIAIDQKLRRLYWCDARLDKIEACDMDGSNRVILMFAAPQHPFALTIWENYVFWTDWLARAVFKADKYTGQQPVQIKKVVQRPMGIAVAAPDTYECYTDRCSIDNGGCPVGFTCVMRHESGTLPSVECRPSSTLSHDIVLPAPRCKYSKNGCDSRSYHDIIMYSLDRYNVTELMPLATLRPSDAANIEMITSSSGNTNFSGSSITPRIATDQSTTTSSNVAIMEENKNGTHSLHIASTTGYDTSMPTTHSLSESISENTTSVVRELTTINNSPPVSSSTPLPSIVSKSVENPPSGFSPSTKTTPATINPTSTTEAPQTSSTRAAQTISTTLNPSSTNPSQAPLTNATLPPCQIVPAALQPTTDANVNNDCKPPGQFKCYLSERLVCISGDKRCDGSHDCPNKEDENDCYLSKRGPYNLKRETNWHRFVTVILIILAAAVAALFLVFGTRGRRRWFVGTNGAFNHRRMFDDNGTNIEISNPMFDEDDSGNLVHCAFSIDLNERTTNFSNPLYERQVLIMNDKNVTSN